MAKLKDFCSPDTPEQVNYCKQKPFYGILTGSTLFKKDVFDIIGFWQEGVITGDVIDLTTRLLKAGISIKKIDLFLVTAVYTVQIMVELIRKMNIRIMQRHSGKD